LASQKRQHTLPLTIGEARACAIAVATYARSQISHSLRERSEQAREIWSASADTPHGCDGTHLMVDTTKQEYVELIYRQSQWPILND
jgi:hypothetical protein